MKEIMMLRQLERGVQDSLRRWDEARGIPVPPTGYPDTRFIGFVVSTWLTALAHPQSVYAGSEELQEKTLRALHALQQDRRPSGCFDLSSCNFDSAPDTAFTVNALTDARQVAAGAPLSRKEELLAALDEIILRACEGICAGGFHTPNHRWAISACLLQGAALTGREDFAAKARVYLGEGLDIDTAGEFAERSTGTYNAVNDEQMIRLYLCTGEREYLDAARSNLELMRHYLEPDGSLFTLNSTRQDRGHKPAPSSYYPLYLMTGMLLEDETFAAWSQVIWEACASLGETPRGLIWLMRFPQLREWLERGTPDRQPLLEDRRVWPASGIGRWRRGALSVTALAHQPCFLAVANGQVNLQASIYANVCAQRNFVPDAVEETPTGFRLHSRADSWYYLPFEGDGPDTRDWWAMDNPATRRRQIRDAMDLTVTGDLVEGGLQLTIRAEGLSGVPLRLELSFSPGVLRGEQFVMDAKPGGSILLTGGRAELLGESGDCLTISPCFAAHRVMNRMGGALPEDPSRFTVYLTGVTPLQQTLLLGTERLFGPVI